jgi:hypothetical protein
MILLTSSGTVGPQISHLRFYGRTTFHGSFVRKLLMRDRPE